MILSELYSFVLAALNRQVDPQAQAMLPVWRTMAESDIFGVLRAGWMVRRGGAIFANPIEVLPPSILQILGVTLLRINVPVADVSQLVDKDGNPIIFDGGMVDVPGNTVEPDYNVVGDLQALGPDQIGREHYAPGALYPKYYVIEGFTIRLLPWISPNSWVNITYYSSGKPLVNPTDFNETLSRAPALYQYGMLKHAAIFYGDSDGQDRWTQQLINGIAEINSMSYGWQGTGFVAKVG
jgi:hypothetical protein